MSYLLKVALFILPTVLIASVFGGQPQPTSQVTARQLEQVPMAHWEKWKTPVVSIKTRAAHAAYTDPNTFFGTGIIIDAKEGIILTNAHITGVEQVATYEITYHNGREEKAQLLYVDPHHDFAFLKTNPQKIPTDATALKISPDIKRGMFVFMIGKNENKNFSVQTGTIASIFEATGILPQQVFRISLNAQGGASGSPVYNEAGQMIGLVHASNGLTSAFALPMTYVLDALQGLKEKKLPARQGIGVILNYFSLDEAVRFFKYPDAKVAEYLKKYPESFNKILRVTSILPQSPSEKFLQVGDLILAVNGVDIGPDLYKYAKILNGSKGHVQLKVFRLGQELDFTIPLEDLYTRQISKIVNFAGATFYEADDFMIRRSGLGGKKVFVSNLRQGSSFIEHLPLFPNSSKAIIAVESFDDMPIRSLDDVIKMIPSLIAKEDFTIVFRNYGVEFGYDNTPLFSQMPQVKQITFNTFDGIPEVFTFDRIRSTWVVQHINPQQQPMTIAPQQMKSQQQITGKQS